LSAVAKCAQCGRNLSGFSFGKRTCQWCKQYEAAQRGEAADDTIQQVMPAPWTLGGFARPMTQAIFGINVAVFVGMVLAGVSITDPTGQELIQWGANSGRLTLAGEWWRLVTCMFLHIGILHIALNMWCLWSLGALAESLYGSWLYGAVYLISGIGGSLASIAWHPYGSSAGASGAIFGLAGALIASYRLGEFSAPSTVVGGTLRSMLAFAGFNIVLGAISPSTDNAAHLGGLATGAILGALIAVAAPRRNAVAARIAIVLLGSLMMLGCGYWLEYARGYEIRVIKANELIGKNQSAQAIAELQKIVRRKPKLVSAHFALAHAYFSLQQFPQAEAELKQVLALRPQDEWASYELGMTYLSQRRTAEAKKVFTDRLQRSPKDSDAHFGLGLALSDEGDYKDAISEFKTVVGLDSQAEGAYYQIGAASLKLKQYDDAIEAFGKEQTANGDNYAIEAGLAEAYKGKGMTGESTAAQVKAEQLEKNDKGH
jgi:rhomboid protease GluP